MYVELLAICGLGNFESFITSAKMSLDSFTKHRLLYIYIEYSFAYGMSVLSVSPYAINTSISSHSKGMHGHLIINQLDY